MKSERIINALGRADDKYVAEAAPERLKKAAAAEEAQGSAVTYVPRRRRWGGRIAAAAGACAAVGGLVAWGALGGIGGLIEGPVDISTPPSMGSLTEDSVGSGTQDDPPESNEYQTVWLAREELYSNPLSRPYAPRVYPEGFTLESAMYKTLEEGGHREFLDLYISNDNFRGYVEDPNLIFFRVSFDGISSTVLSNSRPEYDIATLTVKDIEERLKTDRGINLSCGENVIVCLTVDNAETISAEELYKMIMSMPASGNFAASGIKTGELPDGITTDNAPVVDCNEYYDIKRYAISEELLDQGSGDYVCGFDGECAYIRKGFREGDIYDRDSPLGSSLVRYDLTTGESSTLVSGIGSYYFFICADSENLYYGRHLLTSDNRPEKTEISILSFTTGEIITPITLGANTMNYTLPVVENNEIWIAAEYEGKNAVIRLDMSCANEKNGSFGNYIKVLEAVDSVEYMTPYKGGILFEAGKSDAEGKRNVYFWDGENEPYTLLTTTKNVFTVDDAVLYTETVPFSPDNICSFVGVYGLSDGSDSPSTDYLAECSLPYFSERLWAEPSDGMVEVSGNGIIYDARNGWFTQIQSSSDYRILGKPVGGGGALLMFEQDDSEEPTFDNYYSYYPYKVTAIYVVKRK